MNNHGSWYFDTSAGKDEILFRRIGKNELAAMDACRDLVEAEKQYFAHPPVTCPKQFAQKLVSDEGRHNGLYWHGARTRVESPIDPLIAYARQEYPDGPGWGSCSVQWLYVSDTYEPRTTCTWRSQELHCRRQDEGGFAFVAYPVEYRSSGVMTFIVDESGAIYEKDLGPNTTKLAKR